MPPCAGLAPRVPRWITRAGGDQKSSARQVFTGRADAIEKSYVPSAVVTAAPRAGRASAANELLGRFLRVTAGRG